MNVGSSIARLRTLAASLPDAPDKARAGIFVEMREVADGLRRAHDGIGSILARSALDQVLGHAAAIAGFAVGDGPTGPRARELRRCAEGLSDACRFGALPADMPVPAKPEA